VSVILGCIADDYTGASDLANTLTKNGLRTVQTIGVPRDGLELPPVDAIVIAMKIRSIPAAEAVARARKASGWLQAHGVSHTLYKICSTFDSTEEGNIGPITEALRDNLGADIVLVTPAFPETGRTVYLGHLFVGSVPLNESPLKDHPLNPMRDANLVRVLARQCRGKIGLADLFTVTGGADRLQARLAELSASGHVAAIADAVFEHDLEVLGEVAAKAKLSTGASGLGFGLARAFVKAGLAAGGIPDDDAAVKKPVGGLAAIIAGSCSRATLEQVAAAEQVMPVLRLDQEGLIEERGEIERALHWAADRISAGPVLIASSAEPNAVARIQQKYGRDVSGRAIEQGLAAITQGLIAAGVRRLVVAGGETAGAAVDRLGIEGFLVGPEIDPGVPLLRVWGRDPQLLMALKSGNFGGPKFFEKALALMR